MPYIKEPQKEALDTNPASAPLNAGELNYRLTKAILQYLSLKGHSYQTYNDCIGALEGCKLELYRRLVAPYEAEKIIDNGDVY